MPHFSAPDAGFRIAVDIGGTFTDCVVSVPGRTSVTTKAPTTPHDFILGIEACLSQAAGALDLDTRTLLEQTTHFVHGSTIGTNTIVERTGARVGLLGTFGHEEAITIGRARQKVAGLSEREITHVSHLQKASPPIVNPVDIRGVRERIDRTGRVLAPLDLAHAMESVTSLVSAGVESLAISLLWSFVNPSHEQLLAESIRAKYPEIYVSTSSAVIPRLGEYERTTATVFNAYIGPRVVEYLKRLERRLTDAGLASSVLIMQASGGIASLEEVYRRPILTLDSGPAGGVLGARDTSEKLGVRNAICADVGGTTFDVGMVMNSRIIMDENPVLDQYQYAMPKVYLKSVGAGGGSIVWQDRAGRLRVGPQSAGAAPGPASYGKGGTEATVTDACVVLGYLDPEAVLGGNIRIDAGKAEKAIKAVADRMEMSVVEAAAGILTIFNSQLADLVRKTTIERGLDPREFIFLSYGGAGALFAASVAHQTRSYASYIVRQSGVFSAAGMLTGDLVHQEERSVAPIVLAPDPAQIQLVNDEYANLKSVIEDRFVAQGHDPESIEYRKSAEMRFRMQVHEIQVEVPDGELTSQSFLELSNEFVNQYRVINGDHSADAQFDMELVKLRVTGTIRLQRSALAIETEGPGTEMVADRHREAYFPEAAGWHRTAVFDDPQYEAGATFLGPAIIQRPTDTIVIPPNFLAKADSDGGLLISSQAARPDAPEQLGAGPIREDGSNR